MFVSHRFFMSIAAWSLAFAASADASTIVVDPSGAGGAFTSLQAALNAAPPGAIVEVHGGTYAAITITKPVTIVGKPRPTILQPEQGDIGGFDCPPALTISGPGVGAVTLSDLNIGGVVQADVYGTFAPSVDAKGFTMLELTGCAIIGPKLNFANGVGVGGEGLWTTIPLVFLRDTSITGGANTTETECVTKMPLGVEGINAQNSTVVVLDSLVRGGDGSDWFLCFGSKCNLQAGAQPCPCASLGGFGGAGIKAHRVFVANSLVTGGKGMEIKSGCGDQTPVPWGKQPDGPAYATGTIVVPMTQNLGLLGVMKLGTSPTLTMPAGSNQLLVFSTSAPTLIELGYGPLFLDPTKPLFVTPIAAGTTSISTPIPANAALIGVHVGVQVFDPSGLSRPVIDVIKP